VIALDLVSTAPTAFSYLAPFAKAFSGNGYAAVVGEDGKTTYVQNPHVTGYDSEAYNAKIDAAAAEKNEKKRAALLVEAEEFLMKDMPVIPVVYNKNTTLTAKKLSGVKAGFFCPNILTDAKLSGYWKIALRDGFVEKE
jgi:ABC-type transport system substrate-binding protein